MHGRSLPKLELKTVGLHVGGGPNDLTTQRAFTGAIALQFQAFQACYRYVSAPKQQAIFGVDLLMPPESGRAQVKAVRTSLRGDPFVVCMRQAFEEIRFRNPLKRPTMVSYSVRFTLVGLNAETPSRP